MAPFQKAWEEIVQQALSDPQFKQQLMDNPHDVLRSKGIDAPQGVNIVVQQNDAQTYFLTLPQQATGELSEQELAAYAAGIGGMWSGLSGGSDPAGGSGVLT